MSVQLPPFRIGPESGETDGVPRSIDLARLRAALGGRDARVSVLAAVRVVTGSNLPDKVALLASVLRNRELGPDPRRQAAIALGYVKGVESQALLVAALADAETRVQVAAAKSLGWIGDATAYDALVALMRSLSGVPAPQVEWAARLIAHRHGLAAPELPPLRLGERIDFTTERRPVRVVRARAERLRLCLDSIARRNFRLRFDSSLAHELHCGRSEWMLLVTDGAARAPARMRDRRSIAAAAALFLAGEQRFSIALIVLVEPAGRLIVCRSTGEPVFAGELRVEGDRAAFSLGAVSRPGAFPLLLEGSLATAALAIREAVSGPVVIAKQQPVPIDMTSR